MDSALSSARSALVTSIEDVVASMDRVDQAVAAARDVEDNLEVVHDLLERRYGIGLISDWTRDPPGYEGPVVTVRLAIDVVDEESRDTVLPIVDERLCQALDAERFALLSTQRVFPGARGSAADPHSPRVPSSTTRSMASASRVDRHLPVPKLAMLRDHVISDLDVYLEALGDSGEHPGKKAIRRLYKRQNSFETSLDRLHRRVLRKTGAPLVTTWAHLWGEMPESGPVIALTLFDIADSETSINLVGAIGEVLDGFPLTPSRWPPPPSCSTSSYRGAVGYRPPSGSSGRCLLHHADCERARPQRRMQVRRCRRASLRCPHG